MGVAFWLFSKISIVVTVIILTLCISSGLYLLSELAEEFPTAAGKILKYLLVVVTVLQIILLIDGLPLKESGIQIATNMCYAAMLMKFPFLEFFSWQSIVSVLMFLVSNIIWLRYFLDNHSDALAIIGYFVMMVWILPCGLFVSLSINDNTLPGIVGATNDNGLSNTSSTSKNKSIFRVIYEFLQERMESCLLTFGLLNPFKLLQTKKK